MKISMIIAIDLNNAIGKNNQLLWHLPDDFKWFKTQTKGKPMVMGRNTMDSIGRVLPGRQNIVLSSKNTAIIEGFEHAFNYEEALNLLPENTEELMIIGGGKVYQNLMNYADMLYITEVQHRFEDADTFFPKININDWHLTFEEFHPQDEKHAYSFRFLIYERK